MDSSIPYSSSQSILSQQQPHSNHHQSHHNEHSTTLEPAADVDDSNVRGGSQSIQSSLGHQGNSSNSGSSTVTPVISLFKLKNFLYQPKFKPPFAPSNSNNNTLHSSGSSSNIGNTHLNIHSTGSNNNTHSSRGDGKKHKAISTSCQNKKPGMTTRVLNVNRVHRGHEKYTQQEVENCAQAKNERHTKKRRKRRLTVRGKEKVFFPPAQFSFLSIHFWE